MFGRFVRLAILPAAVACLSTSQAWACPMCKFAIEADDPKPRAYMFSILFMLIAIGSVVTGLIFLLNWISRHERAALDAAGYQHLFENGVSEQAAGRGASPSSGSV